MNWGPLTLTQNGGSVTGQYRIVTVDAYGYEVSVYGSIAGNVTGSGVEGYWEDWGWGTFRIQLSVDRQSFSGYWWYADGTYGGTFSGQYLSSL